MAFDFNNEEVKVNAGHQQQNQQHQKREGVNRTQASFLTGDRGAIGLRNPMASSVSGGITLDTIYQRAREICDENNKENNAVGVYNVMRLLADDYNLNYSGVVFALTKNNVTAVHVMLIEATGHYPEPQSIKQHIAGVEFQYDFIQPPSQALDRFTQEAVVNLTRGYLGLTNSDKVNFVDGMLVPTEFDAQALLQSPTRGVDQLIYESEAAVKSEIARVVYQYSGESIKNMVTELNGYFDVDLDFNTAGKNFYDVTGMPIRQDICIKLNLRSNNKGNGSVHQTRPISIVNTYGYIDFIRQPNPDKNPMASAGFGFMGMQMGAMYQPDFKFNAQWITTHTESPSFIMTEHISVLSLASLALLTTEDRTWLQAFLTRSTPRGKNAEINYNDPGMLGIEGGNITPEQYQAYLTYGKREYGVPFDTTAKDFTALNMAALINQTVLPDLIISWDIADAGPQTWHTSIFRTMADRSEKRETNRNAAIARFEKSVSTLTGEEFTSNNAVAPFIPVVDLIHSGFYMHGREARDLRHLSSYLAVAAHINASGEDKERLSMYADTIMSESDTDRIRACNRFPYIQEMALGTQVVKGYYRRVTFFGPYYTAVVNAVKDAGFVINPLNSNRFGNEIYTPKGFNLAGAGVHQGLNIMGAFDNTVSGGGNFYGYDRSWGV